MITTDDLRKQWLNFFASHSHAVIPSAGVIPENDPTALFHNSGMHPLVPYLMGETHPKGTRLVNCQKCIRTGDIDEVGDSTHLTFFEMLGNWSLGDFFKKEQIQWSYDFLTKELNLPLEKIAVSVFEGDSNAPRDTEAAEFWRVVGMPVEKIAYLPASENWWAKGETGPCGPDTEMFYWRGETDDLELKKPFQETWENPNWVEIWNDVFMQYQKMSEEKSEENLKKEIDTVTEDIIGLAIEIHKKYQGNMTEKQIQNMLADKISAKNYSVQKEEAIPIMEDGKTYSSRFIDLVVESHIFIELKNTTSEDQIKKEFKQLRNYLELHNGIAGLVLNFAENTLDIHRLNNFEKVDLKPLLQTSSILPLPQKNVDTGMGLERTVAVLNGKNSVYETDAFAPVLEKIAEISGHPEIAQNPVGESDVHHSARIIADHLRSACVILADLVTPSNVDQGYILRRLIRRAIRHGRKIGVHQNLCVPVAETVITKLGSHYVELETNKDFIWDELIKEEENFRHTLEKGEKMFEKITKNSADFLSGDQVFDLFQTYGFPLEITEELATEKGITVDRKGFKKAFEAHQKASRAGSEQKFKGGLADHTEATTKLHTATHLMLAGLREILGDHVHQAGSNITSERLRFDFTHSEKVTPEQISAVEHFVNKAIAANAEQILEEIPKEEAKARGVEGSFWEKYPDVVKVYTFRDSAEKIWSQELCGGPHWKNTGDLGMFKIKKEESSSAGVRRIKAVLK